MGGCLCLSDCCQCGGSTMRRTVQVISVIDMIASVVYVTYETANFGLLTGIIQPKSEQNCTNCSTLAEYVPETLLSKFDYETFTVMTMIVLIFLGFIIEGSMYSRLKTGKRLNVHHYCKQWVEWRLVLLGITVLMAVGKYFRGIYTLTFDGVVDIVTKLYRVITLILVKCFMKELEMTVGIVYVKPPKPRKRGSLSLK